MGEYDEAAERVGVDTYPTSLFKLLSPKKVVGRFMKHVWLSSTV